MPRRLQFQSGRDPLHAHTGLNLRPEHVSGPVSFLNPTRARYAAAPEQIVTPKPAQIEHIWRSRDNRKGRHLLQVDYALPRGTEYALPPRTATLHATAQGLLRMATRCPYWDVSYLVATVFTAGSVVWVINAFFAWLPLQDPSTTFPGESLVGGGVTAFIGATIFEVGSLLLLLEAVNENQTGCFGWALETVLRRVEEGGEERPVTELRPSDEECAHHHTDSRSLVGQHKEHDRDNHGGRRRRSGSTKNGKRRKSPMRESLEDVLENGVTTRARDGRAFNWIPSWKEIRSHYMHELGFQASFIQFVGASIFWIAGLTGLPGIINHMDTGVEDALYWTPQIVGGFCFVASGLLFTLETQDEWYRPAPRVLGWHIGAWNFIGGIGFTLCGALGPASAANSGVAYQTSLATFWGSWAFLIGSTIQWYESLQKHPVEAKSTSP